MKSVTDADDLMITTGSGVTIRTPADALRVMGRSTQGVRIIRLDEGEEIADVVVVGRQEEDSSPVEEIDGLENADDNQTESPAAETSEPPVGE